jgi:hypothetical protein
MFKPTGLVLALAVVAAPVLASTDQDTVIYYDTGNTVTWWCSDRDSFGAGVKFTPSEYPCEIIGARAEINYDGGREIYLRVWDDDGQGGLPGTILYNEQRLDIPPNRTPGFHDYDLSEPVRIDSGDFYIVFWQKNIWDMQFSSDEAMDHPARQWWWFPDQGWVTPSGMDASDHLIRAKVSYGTGISELLGPKPASGLPPTVMPRAQLLSDLQRDSTLSLFDASGRRVLNPGSFSGILFLRTSTSSRRVIILR